MDAMTAAALAFANVARAVELRRSVVRPRRRPTPANFRSPMFRVADLLDNARWTLGSAVELAQAFGDELVARARSS